MKIAQQWPRRFRVVIIAVHYYIDYLFYLRAAIMLLLYPMRKDVRNRGLLALSDDFQASHDMTVPFIFRSSSR